MPMVMAMLKICGDKRLGKINLTADNIENLKVLKS